MSRLILSTVWQVTLFDEILLIRMYILNLISVMQHIESFELSSQSDQNFVQTETPQPPIATAAGNCLASFLIN